MTSIYHVRFFKGRSRLLQLSARVSRVDMERRIDQNDVILLLPEENAYTKGGAPTS